MSRVEGFTEALSWSSKSSPTLATGLIIFEPQRLLILVRDSYGKMYEHERNASHANLCALYPHMPVNSVLEILDNISKGKVQYAGRSGILDSEWKLNNAVTDYIRNTMTDYGTLLSGIESKKRSESRRLAAIVVRKEVDEIIYTWRNGATKADDDSLGGSAEDQAKERGQNNEASIQARDALISLKASSQSLGCELPQNLSMLNNSHDMHDITRLKLAQIASRKSRSVIKIVDVTSRVSKRGLSSYNQSNLEMLGKALARIDINSNPPTTEAAALKMSRNRRRKAQRCKFRVHDPMHSTLNETRSPNASLRNQLQEPRCIISGGVVAMAMQDGVQTEEQMTGVVNQISSLRLGDPIPHDTNSDTEQPREHPVRRTLANAKILTKREAALRTTASDRQWKRSYNRAMRTRCKDFGAVEAQLRSLARDPRATTRQIAQLSRAMAELKAQVENRLHKAEQPNEESSKERLGATFDDGEIEDAGIE